MAAWTKRVLVFLVLVAMVAGLTPSASAQEQPTANRDPSAEPTPETFIPTAVNRTPVGGPVPAGMGGLLGGRDEGPGPRRELIERRTEDSETFDVGDGVLETTFYGGAVNYRDDAGAWQRIDPTLVPATGGGAALRTKAGPVEVELPAALGAAPVRVSSEEASVAFTLRGAKGGPRVGVPAAAALKVPAEVAQASATYPEALPGVSVTYAAMPEGVKEELVLASPQAQATFDFDVSLSKGLSALAGSDGGISIVDGQGVEQASLASPFVYDQRFARDGDLSGYGYQGATRGRTARVSSLTGGSNM